MAAVSTPTAMDVDGSVSHVLAQFKSESGEVCGAPFDLPLNVTVDKLAVICNAFLQKEETVPYAFYVQDRIVNSTLEKAVDGIKHNSEKVLDIVYQPQAVFKVRPVTRCTSTLPGHSEAVISASFSPDGSQLASGSGDTTVRFWDLSTETPLHTGKGHNAWVLAICWAPNGRRLASGDKSGKILLWDPDTGTQSGRPLLGHKKWITCLSFEPLHLSPSCRRLASASKDGDVRLWDVVLGQTLVTLSGHLQSVSCLRWGGTGLIYTGSQDRTVKVWNDKGVLQRTLQGHAHWVNTLALSTDYVMRTGAFEPSEAQFYRHGDLNEEEMQKKAKARYETARNISGEEQLVSGSDDYTLFLWTPEKDGKSVARMTGHQQLINDVRFSPDTRIIASASFDKSVKLWDGRTGKFLGVLRGHVQAVYQISWSSDSRLLVSGSADSTLKVWNIQAKKLELDLPGHADEVYAVDWAPDGQRVVSGGKDKILKIWRK